MTMMMMILLILMSVFYRAKDDATAVSVAIPVACARDVWLAEMAGQADGFHCCCTIISLHLVGLTKNTQQF